MANEDGRVSNAAVANLIRMEAQNQVDEHKAQPDLVDVNVHAQKLEDPDFYGNYDQLAAMAKATGIDPWVPREADDLRPPLGENGNGSPRILTDPDWYGTNENSEDQTDEKHS